MTMLGARPVTAPGWTGQPKSDLALIDCDVHHGFKKPDDLFPYLPRVYRERVIDQGMLLPGSGYFNVPKRAARTDLTDGCDAKSDDYNGRSRGDDYQTLKEVHLDLWNVDRVLLTGSNVYSASIIPDPDYAAALCRAFNDWTLEHWAARDERFIVAISVAANEPQKAAEEIRRLGGHKQVVAVMLPTGARMPYGNRFYHPIWRACEETGLVVGIHPGSEGAGMAGPPTGVGYPTYYIETRMARPQMAMAHAVSLIAEGVFEKFPRLKVLFDECDQFWAVGLMWHMDADWKSLREQTPWVKRLPSEYFRGHIRVGSQPMLEPESDDQFFCMLDAMHAEETLVYSSDWPHWDWDDPATTFPKLPERLHRRVFCENARELFGL
ncbi:MAG TPA: amidohydrolase family protein [Chloroflexota bacterium]